MVSTDAQILKILFKGKNVTIHYEKVKDIIEGNKECPLPLEVIPNQMGINLCSVDAIGWQKRDDGQLVHLTIHFNPSE